MTLILVSQLSKHSPERVSSLLKASQLGSSSLDLNPGHPDPGTHVPGLLVHFPPILHVRQAADGFLLIQ